MEINREELAWAAGFFDGEGYTGLCRVKKTGRQHYKKYPVVSISQGGSGEELHRFNQAVGNIGKVRGPIGPYHTNQKPYYQLEMSGFERVQAAIAMLWCFLSSVKRAQARSVIEKYLEQPDRAKEVLRTHCKRGHAWTEANTYIAPKSGARQCKACNKIRERNRIRRLKSKPSY